MVLDSLIEVINRVNRFAYESKNDNTNLTQKHLKKSAVASTNHVSPSLMLNTL